MRTLIAVPCHEMVHADFMRCLLELEKPEGTGLAIITNTLIYTARNLIAQNAVKNGFDRVMWFDSDMTFPSDTLIRLSEHLDRGIEFVSGLYFSRKYPFFPVIHKEVTWKLEKDGLVNSSAEFYHDYPKDRLFEIASCGFGCCMTSASLLQRMCEKYGSPFYPLMGMGEDTTFCFRVTENGGKVYCDSGIKAGHIGWHECKEADYEQVRQYSDDH